MNDETSYSFLATYGSGTLRFDASPEQVLDIVNDLGGLTSGKGEDDARSALREIVRVGFLDNDHLDPLKSQLMAQSIIWLCMTSGPYKQNPSARGLMVSITDKPDGSSNFRFGATGDAAGIDAMTAKAREGAKYVVSVTKEEAMKAAQRKKAPVPKDPSLEPPPKPRPERWIKALEVGEKLIGKEDLAVARECLEEGVCFVWRSRQTSDASREDIDASLSAMAEYDRLHLPFPRIWVETRDWIDLPHSDGPVERVHARFGIAAAEDNGSITYWGFADVNDKIVMSVQKGAIDRDLLVNGQRYFNLDRHPSAASTRDWNEASDRRIALACGDRLLELLFLLSCSGVVRERVREGSGGSKRQKAQRRMSARDYTIIRVPLAYVPGEPGKGGEGGATGGWVRVHVRRAHMWGKNVRPLEEQRYVAACLVGASRLEDASEVRRPEYHVG